MHSSTTSSCHSYFGLIFILEEGLLVRTLRSLEELLRRLKILGKETRHASLELLAADCIGLIRRDIPFMPSLYHMEKA